MEATFMLTAPPGRVVAFGEVMERTSDGVSSLGGAEWNVAAALGNIDVPVAWVSALPTDSDACAPLEARGVHTANVVRNAHPLGIYDISSGTPVYDRADSAFAHLDPQAFDWRKLLTGARWVVLSGITPMLGPGPRAAWGGALTFAELDGTLIALDLNHRPALCTFEGLWSLVRPRLRMIHTLVLAPGDLAKIARLEEMPVPTDYDETVATLEAVRRKFLIPNVCACFKAPNGDGSQRRWSVVAHTFGLDSTDGQPLIHSPVEPLGGGDAWLAGFISALMEHGHGPASAAIGAMRGDALAALAQRTQGDISEAVRADLDAVDALRLAAAPGEPILIT